MRFNNHFGIDIGGDTIKLVQLSQSGQKFRLAAIAVAQASKSENKDEKDLADADAIKKLIHDSGANGKACVVSLPESEVYTRVIEMPFMEEPDLTSAIRWQAEQYIPVPLEDVVLKHQILSLPDQGVPGSKMQVLLVAAPNDLISRYLALFERVKIEPLAIETEIFAVARALISTDAISPTTLLVNFGSEATTLAVLKKGDLSLTQSVNCGGLAINRALSSSLGLEMTQAEQYKKTYGLDPSVLERKVYGSVKPIIDQVLAEVKKVAAFYETRPASSAVKRVVLTGGTAMMPGLLGYFSQSLQLEVQLGNPFVNLILSDKQKQAVFEAGPLFAAAVGLGMKLT